MERIWHTYRTLRCLQLYVRILNVVNRNIIFTWKLVCIGVSIMCGYAGIAHFKDHPIFGLMYYVIFLDASLVYIVIYEKAFKVPALFKQAVNAELTKLGPGNGRAMSRTVNSKALMKQFRSIPSMAIKVGRFHSLERNSTPAFLDFVLRNIVGMLMAFN